MRTFKKIMDMHRDKLWKLYSTTIDYPPLSSGALINEACKDLLCIHDTKRFREDELFKGTVEPVILDHVKALADYLADTYEEKFRRSREFGGLGGGKGDPGNYDYGNIMGSSRKLYRNLESFLM